MKNFVLLFFMVIAVASLPSPETKPVRKEMPIIIDTNSFMQGCIKGIVDTGKGLIIRDLRSIERVCNLMLTRVAEPINSKKAQLRPNVVKNYKNISHL